MDEETKENANEKLENMWYKHSSIYFSTPKDPELLERLDAGITDPLRTILHVNALKSKRHYERFLKPFINHEPLFVERDPLVPHYFEDMNGVCMYSKHVGNRHIILHCHKAVKTV